MHRTGAGGRVTEAGGHVVVLAAALGGDFDHCADPVAIALGSFQRNIQPVASTFAAVHPDLRRFAQGCGYYIDAAIAVQVAKSASPVARWSRSLQPGFFGQCLPFTAGSWISEDCIGLIDDGPGQVTGYGISAGDKQILPAVVVKIIERCAERRHGQRQGANTGFRRHFTKFTAIHILEQWKSLFTECHVSYIRVAIVIEISEIQTHSSDEISILR